MGSNGLTKKQRIETLEKEVSELKLIVHELRERKETVVKIKGVTIGEPSTDNSVEDKQADIIEFEGQQYRKVERHTKEGDIITFYGSDHPQITNGKPYKVHKNEPEGFLYHYADSGTDYPLDGNYVEGWYVHEPIQPVQRQTVPCSATRPPIEEVGEAFFEAANEVLNPKTANQLRAEVIEKAKGFVDSRFKEHWNQSGDLVVSTGLILHTVEFVVNEEKRQVNALLRSYGKRGKGAVDYNGKAKCNPSDVFNEHIGKAIALGRALGLDVSEFEQAVQPTVAIGQKIEVIDWEGSATGMFRIVESIRESKYPSYKSGWASKFKIINDTNAIYGGVE